MERCRWEGQKFHPLKEVQRLEEDEDLYKLQDKFMPRRV